MALHRDFSPSYDVRTWVDPAWTTGSGQPPGVADRLARHKTRWIVGPVGAGVIALSAWALSMHKSVSSPGVALAAGSPVASTDGAAPAATASAATFPQSRALALDSLSELVDALQATGFDSKQAAAIATTARTVIGATPGPVRGLLHFTSGKDGPHLDALDLSRADGSSARVTPDATGGFTGIKTQALAAQTFSYRGQIDRDSFYTSAITAGVPDSIIPDMAAAFVYDFNFAREIHANDVFEAAVEQNVDASGEPMGTPRLVFVMLRTPEKSRSLYRYATPGREPGWYDANGASAMRSFMRTPVDSARVTSKFGLRLHPIDDIYKPHNGIDFGVPIGTHIYAAADGVTIFVGPKGNNGNFIKILHDNGWNTLYLHMQGFAPGIVTGTRVHQGQLIGFSGTTGKSTGPHLHYEVHIDGKPVDPLGIRTEAGHRLEGAALAAFFKVRDRIDLARRK